MGRVKLKIKKLENINARQGTYAKRKHGIMKKARELSILCDIDVVLLMFSPTGKPTLCCGKHSIGEVIAKFAQLTPQERAKRKLENLEALKKTFMKLDHDVNVSEFLDRSKPTVEVLSERVRFLQTQLSETHTRLSYWTEVKKINRVDDLQQLESSLRQSLNQIRAHKENMMQHQQQQLMSSDCKNQLQNEIDLDSLRQSLNQIRAHKENILQHQKHQLISSDCKIQLQNEIELDFGIDMEQHLENFTWVRNDENINVPVQEEDPNAMQLHHNTYKDITCSASSSLGSYSGLFGKTSDNISTTDHIETGYIPVDPNLQFSSNLSFLNDPKLHQQLAEWNLLGSPADYYVSQILEASSKPQYSGNWASSHETLTYNPVAVFDDPLFSRPN